MPEQGTGCRRCCSCPHGGLPVLPGVLSAIAWIFSTSAVSTCYFLFMEIQGTYWGVDGGLGFTGYGEWHVDYDNYEDDRWWDDDEDWCNDYPSGFKDTQFDGAWKAGYAFGIMSTVIGGITMIVTFTVCCTAFPPVVFNIMAGAYLVAALFQGLTLVALSSDICPDEANSLFSTSGLTVECRFGWGAGLAVGALILWFICACTIKVTPRYKDDLNYQGAATHTTKTTTTGGGVATAAPAAGTTTITETIQSDGTKVIEKVTTMPDGSKVAETTTEKPN